MGIVKALLVGLALVLLAGACSGSDGDDDDDFAFELEAPSDDDDSGGSGNDGASGGEGSGDGDSGGDGDSDGDGGGDGSAAPNPLCPSSDVASPPAGFPFGKPASMAAIGYDTPSAGGAEYTLRGVTTDPASVISELMTVVFPAATFTQTSTAAGQEAFDFVDRVGLGEYISVTINGCTNLSITLVMGAAPTDGDAADTASTSSDAVAEGAPAGDSSSSGAAQPAGEPTVNVLSVAGTFSPTPSVCIINSTQIQIVASGDGDLTITGDANEITLQFTSPAGETETVTEPAFGMGAGTLMWVTSTGVLIEATDCAS